MAKKKSNAQTRRKRRLQRWRNALALIALLLAAATVFSGFRAFGTGSEATEAEETTAATAEETTDETTTESTDAGEGTTLAPTNENDSGDEGTDGSGERTPTTNEAATETEAEATKSLEDDKQSAEAVDATVLIGDDMSDAGMQIFSTPKADEKSLESCAKYDTVTLYPGTCFVDKDGDIWMQVTAKDVTGWTCVGHEIVRLESDSESGYKVPVGDEGLSLYDEDGNNKTAGTDEEITVERADMAASESSPVAGESYVERKVKVTRQSDQKTYWVIIRTEYVEFVEEQTKNQLWELFEVADNAQSNDDTGQVAIYEELGGSDTGTTYPGAFHISYEKTDADGNLWGKTDKGWVKMAEVSMEIPNATVVAETLHIRKTPQVAEDNKAGSYSLGKTLTVEWDTLTPDEGGAPRTWVKVKTSDDNYWVCYKEQGEDGRDNFYLNHIPPTQEEADAESKSNQTQETTETTEPPTVSSNPTGDDSKVLSRDGMEEEESTPNYWKIVFFVCVGLLAADLIAVVVLTMQIEKIQDTAEIEKQGPSGSKSVQYPTVGCLSNQGKRPSQQDSFCVARTFGGTGILAAVADGMGGLSGGDQVSGRIVKDVQEFAPRIQPQDMDTVLPNLVNLLSDDINKMLGPNGIYKSGSTLLLVLTDGKRFSWASVGDSRICLYRAGVLNHVNPEHNQFTTEWMPKVQRGEMTLQQAHSDPANGRKLTSFIGMGKLRYVSRSQTSAALMPGDRIILMSDGVFNTLSDEKLAQLLGQYSNVQEAARQIQQSVLAADARGQDNFTAVILGF